MRLPKRENWTFNTSERLVKRLWSLFDSYESLAEFDENGRQVNKKAEGIYYEGMHLEDELPVADARMLKHSRLFA